MRDASTANAPSKKATTGPKESTPPLRTFSWPYWLVLTCLVVSLIIYFAYRGKHLHAASITPTSILDTRIMGFTPSEARETLRALGPKGRDIYKEINRIDFVLAPIVFREYLLNTFPATSRRNDFVRELMANMCGLGDLLENVSVAIMLKTYPKVLDIFAWAGCVGNVVKNVGIFFSILSVLYEAYVWIRGRKLKKQ